MNRIGRNPTALLPLWQEIRLQRIFTIDSLTKACPTIAKGSVERCIKILRKKGYVVTIERRKAPDSRARFCTYQLVQDVGMNPPSLEVSPSQRITLRQKIWNSARILRTFSVEAIEITAETEYNSAWRYLRSLLKTGYLTRKGIRRHYVYQLVRNTGPLAPVEREDGKIYDPNTNQIYGGSNG